MGDLMQQEIGGLALEAAASLEEEKPHALESNERRHGARELIGAAQVEVGELRELGEELDEL
jgi:hypothetical protein